MSVYPQIGVTGNATILPQGAADLVSGEQETIMVTSQDGLTQCTIAGAGKPWPGIQDGIILSDGIKGLSPGFKHIDLKAARQPGVTWTGTAFDVLEMDLALEAHANTPQGMSKLVSEWTSMWHPTQLNTFEYITQDRGYWYFPARLSKPFPDAMKKMPRLLLQRKFTQTIRCDSGFWYGMPSISEFQTSELGGNSGFLRLLNIGQEDGWPTLLFYAGSSGGATFHFSNGPGSTTMISFGPLEANQIVLMRTLPRLRTLTDLTNVQTVQNPNGVQALIEAIVAFVYNNNVPPLIQWFESLFGILPTQGPLYTLLNGRYSNPFPGVRQPQWATAQYLSVAITGGNADSKIVGRIDPQRWWPE